jgi:hypothetical protein
MESPFFKVSLDQPAFSRKRLKAEKLIDSKELEQLIRVQTDAGCSSVDNQGVALGADARKTRVRSEIRKSRLSSQPREVNEISRRGAAPDNARTCA